jgi:hypothetical protein
MGKHRLVPVVGGQLSNLEVLRLTRNTEIFLHPLDTMVKFSYGENKEVNGTTTSQT